jgi:MYXO-CTERM domain-containing protein
MKRLVVVLVVIAVLAPSAGATEFIGMRTGPNRGADEVDAVVAPGSGEHFLDLLLFAYGDDIYDNVNEYDVMVRAPRPGITLLRAEKPDNNWVFTKPDAVFTTIDSAADHLFINASSPDERVDIPYPDHPTYAARVYYTVDPGTAPGLYRITLEPRTTRTYAVDQINVPVDVTDPGLIQVTPEPSGLAVLAFGGLLALRRRRAPRALQ